MRVIRILPVSLLLIGVLNASVVGLFASLKQEPFKLKWRHLFQAFPAAVFLLCTLVVVIHGRSTGVGFGTCLSSEYLGYLLYGLIFLVPGVLLLPRWRWAPGVALTLLVAGETACQIEEHQFAKTHSAGVIEPRHWLRAAGS